MLVVEIGINNRCVKICLPNGKVADILVPVLAEISKWIQDTPDAPESGGFIVGYQHQKTGNISLEAVSHPYESDYRSRIRFEVCDSRHKAFLKRQNRQKSYYMGVWHTHPQKDPVPSSDDWYDWSETLRVDKTGCQYVFFLIAGTEKWRIWVGDILSKQITEGYEFTKDSEGLYCKNDKKTIGRKNDNKNE